MQEEEKYFSEFVHHTMNYTKYISDLRKDGTWGGNFELIALSHIFKRSVEVYENSEEPRMFEFPSNEGNDTPPIRIFYTNSHYASVRSDGLGYLFNFEELKPGELEHQMVNLNDPSIIRKSKYFKKRIKSIKNFSQLDSATRQGMEQSIALEETEKAYLRYYASKSKITTNQQN